MVNVIYLKNVIKYINTWDIFLWYRKGYFNPRIEFIIFDFFFSVLESDFPLYIICGFSNYFIFENVIDKNGPD